MSDIYKLHDSAFSSVSAFVVTLDNEKVATIALKFPRDGAGRLYAYTHWIGLEMVRGFASGCGYDKRSAALRNAAQKLAARAKSPGEYETVRQPEALQAFIAALIEGGRGIGFDRALRDAGFTIWQAV
jgi:hypothetical protein